MVATDTAQFREPGPNQVGGKDNFRKLLEAALVDTGICSDPDEAVSHPVNGEFGVRADFGNRQKEFIYVQAQEPLRDRLLDRPPVGGSPGDATFSQLELDYPVVILREAHPANPEGVAGVYAAFVRKLDYAGVLCGVQVMGPESRNPQAVVDRTYELIRQTCSANITIAS